MTLGMWTLVIFAYSLSVSSLLYPPSLPSHYPRGNQLQIGGFAITRTTPRRFCPWEQVSSVTPMGGLVLDTKEASKHHPAAGSGSLREASPNTASNQPVCPHLEPEEFLALS